MLAAGSPPVAQPDKRDATIAELQAENVALREAIAKLPKNVVDRLVRREENIQPAIDACHAAAQPGNARAKKIAERLAKEKVTIHLTHQGGMNETVS